MNYSPTLLPVADCVVVLYKRTFLKAFNDSVIAGDWLFHYICYQIDSGPELTTAADCKNYEAERVCYEIRLVDIYAQRPLDPMPDDPF